MAGAQPVVSNSSEGTTPNIQRLCSAVTAGFAQLVQTTSGRHLLFTSSPQVLPGNQTSKSLITFLLLLLLANLLLLSFTCRNRKKNYFSRFIFFHVCGSKSLWPNTVMMLVGLSDNYISHV